MVDRPIATDSPIAKPRRVQFGLRTLLTAVAIFAAIFALCRIWKPLYRYLTANRLVAALRQNNKQVISNTGDAIEDAQGYDGYVIAFSDAMRHSDPEVRKRAVNSFAELLGKTTSEVPPGQEASSELLLALAENLKHPDVAVRQGVVGILGMGTAPGLLGEGAEHGAVPLLTEALNDGDAKVRSLAARMLRVIGPGAKEVVPTLVKMLREEDYEVVKAVTEALAVIDTEASKESDD